MAAAQLQVIAQALVPHGASVLAAEDGVNPVGTHFFFAGLDSKVAEHEEELFVSGRRCVEPRRVCGRR